MMFPLVADLAAEGVPVRLTCGLLGFSPQAFYKWKRRPCSARDWADAHTTNAILDVHADDPEFGYRFPDVLADDVATALTLSVDQRMLRKARPTLKMKYTADRGEKRRALGRAFHAKPIPQGGTVVLVDDVVWTGATLEAAAAALRASGAGRIIALIATRATKGLV
jgi:hypothetical protein